MVSNSENVSKSDNYARECLRQLVRHVRGRYLEELLPITYGDLAERIGFTNKHGKGHGHGMGKVLEKMGHLLNQIDPDIPKIQSMVVSKANSQDNLPSDGIDVFWPQYSNMSPDEKRNKVHAEYQKIFRFGRDWDDVLYILDIKPVDEKGSDDTMKRKFGRGGESPQHKALKEYVQQNPLLVGAGIRDEAIVEYPFPSLDTVDVLFKNKERWIAVEVKSQVSNFLESDYERGLYQCIKYRALWAAMLMDSQYVVPDSFQVFLLLESGLPERYRKTAVELDVAVIENVVVPDGV